MDQGVGCMQPTLSYSGETMARNENYMQAILEGYQKHLNISKDNEMMVDYIVTIVISGVLEKLVDKPWGWLEGPPASGKTEVIMRFFDWASPIDGSDKRVSYLDDLTTNGLVSCYSDPDNPDRDASALNELNNKTLVVKDCSSLTTKNTNEIQKLFGDLTGIYDGTFSKHGGIKGKQSYDVKMSVLLCTTPLSDSLRRLTQQIGERFLSFEIDRITKGVEERIQDVMNAISKSKSKAAWRSELDKVVCENAQKALEFADQNIMDFEIPEVLVRKISVLADFVARLRSSSRLEHATTPESGRRLGCQLMSFGVVRALICGRTCLDGSDLALLQRIAYDTVPRSQKSLFTYLWERPEGAATPKVVRELGLKEASVRTMPNQFEKSGLVSKDPNKILKLTETTRAIVEECGFLLGSPTPISSKIKSSIIQE